MKRPNLYDYLKILAILTMIIDHVGYFFFPEHARLRLVGRIAFPIFLFLIGFSGKYQRRWDIFIMAIIVQIPLMILYFNGYGQRTFNILFSIILARGFLYIYQKIDSYYLLMIVSLIFLVTNMYTSTRFDYGGFAFIFPLIGFLLKNKKEKIYILIYSLAIFGIFLGYTMLKFGFSIQQMYILGACFLFLLYTFFSLGQQNHKINWTKKRDTGITWIAKNSLYIYVFHLLVLSTIKIVLHIGAKA